MKSKILSRSVLATLLLGVAPLHAAETMIDSKAKTTDKKQVIDSMTGFRDTLLFYTFAAEKAVLVVSIDNKSDKFPVTGKLYVFAKETTADGFEKWINNQHSDGLFPDVPEPVAVHNIPAASFAVVSKKIAEAIVVEEGPPNAGKFNRYEVEFKLENVPAVGEIKIKDFTDSASVFVKG